MNIVLIVIGKTDESYLKNGIEQYIQRLKHYTSFSLIELPSVKNCKNEKEQKEKEAVLIQKYFSTTSHVYLLDEYGKQQTSVQFAGFLSQCMNRSIKQLVFIVGGPFGFSDKIKQQAHGLLSLSAMTFSHQMIRLFFVEQLYRGFTIIKGEKYHNE